MATRNPKSAGGGASTAAELTVSTSGWSAFWSGVTGNVQAVLTAIQAFFAGHVYVLDEDDFLEVFVTDWARGTPLYQNKVIYVAGGTFDLGSSGSWSGGENWLRPLGSTVIWDYDGAGETYIDTGAKDIRMGNRSGRTVGTVDASACSGTTLELTGSISLSNSYSWQVAFGDGNLYDLVGDYSAGATTFTLSAAPDRYPAEDQPAWFYANGEVELGGEYIGPLAIVQPSGGEDAVQLADANPRNHRLFARIIANTTRAILFRCSGDSRAHAGHWRIEGDISVSGGGTDLLAYAQRNTCDIDLDIDVDIDNASGANTINVADIASIDMARVRLRTQLRSVVTAGSLTLRSASVGSANRSEIELIPSHTGAASYTDTTGSPDASTDLTIR